MESMPLAKAGVGSAVNDTSREVGGSLGVAILGSILSSGYRANLDLDLSQAPPEAAAAIKEGVGGALGVAQNAPIPAEIAQQITDAARSAFVDGMSPVFWAASGVALLTAGLVLRFMPSRGEVVMHEAGYEPVEAEPVEAEPAPAPLSP
jgi:hypothetical protein